MQAWRVGDERAETYLRLRAETELRRAGDQLRGLDAAAGTGDWSEPGMAPFAAAESAQWRVVRAGRILVAAGALDWDFLDRFEGELFSAITVRSPIELSWYRRQGVLHWDNLPTRTSRAMRQLIAARSWLTVYQLPAYAPELNPVEAVWSNLTRSLANLTKQGIDQLTALVKARLKPMQYRPGLIDGFLAKTGLDLTLP